MVHGFTNIMLIKEEIKKIKINLKGRLINELYYLFYFNNIAYISR